MDELKQIDKRLSNIETLLISRKTVLNFDELALYTGLSKSYLYKLSSSGGIPVYKPNGKNIYADKEEIDRWLLQNKKKSNAETENEAATFVTLNKGGGK